jgi:hypothetical protein
MRDFFDAFDDEARYEIEEIIADGEDFVVAAVSFADRGARSGVPLVLRWVSVAWFHDGKATRVAGYSSRPNAPGGRRPAGVAEQPGASRPMRATQLAAQTVRPSGMIV